MNVRSGLKAKQSADSQLSPLLPAEQTSGGGAQHADEAKIMNGMLFFTYLQKERPDLLAFQTRGDKWQDVHGWLLRAGRVRE